MNKLRDVAATLAAVLGAIAALFAIAWPAYVKPQVKEMVEAAEQRTAARIALIATAAASRDTASLKTFAKYGVPLGPPGR